MKHSESDTVTCNYCSEEIGFNEEVVMLKGDIYHLACVNLRPTSYEVYIFGEYIGRVLLDDVDYLYNFKG